jgi:hypothetical protein
MYICIDKTCMYNTYSKEVRVFKYTFYVSIKYLSTIILVNNQVSDVYILKTLAILDTRTKTNDTKKSKKKTKQKIK